MMPTFTATALLAMVARDRPAICEKLVPSPEVQMTSGRCRLLAILVMAKASRSRPTRSVRCSRFTTRRARPTSTPTRFREMADEHPDADAARRGRPTFRAGMADEPGIQFREMADKPGIQFRKMADKHPDADAARVSGPKSFAPE